MPTNPAPHGAFCIGPSDQAHFGRLSGDLNPLHMDDVAARRLVAGQVVVHGIHTLLRTLEALPSLSAWPSGRIECDFLNPVSVGDMVEVAPESGHEDAQVYIASVDAVPCARITLRAAQLATAAARAEVDVPLTPRLAAPLAWPPEQWVGQHLRLALPGSSFAAAFPRASAQMGERRVAALALLSYFVGMVCPGQHSIFASLVAEAGPVSDTLNFHVRSLHPRFRQFVVSFEGCIQGELRAFERVPAQAQPATADLLGRIGAHEFMGRRAWVIGGSRGLGELAAKMLAAGGADVTVTYASGDADALRVVDDINAVGRGHAAVCRLDIVHDDLAAWVSGSEPPDAVLYFATPRIFRKKAPGLQRRLLDEFLDFYVHRLEALCLALDKSVRGHPFTLFHASTVFIDEPPNGMTEYTMAKASAEILVADLARRIDSLRVVNARLPRLATDQTASLFGTRRESNLDVLLPLVREVMATSAP